MLRKNSLILSRLWLATIMIVVSCVFSSAVPANRSTPTIYARLEETLPPYNGDPNSDDYWQPVTLNVRFYSDAACTTPVAVSTTVTYQISWSGYEYLVDMGNQTLSGIYGTGRAYKGESAVWYDGDVPTWEGLQIYNGVLQWKTSRNYELASIDNGIIIQPAIKVSHLPDFN